MRNIDNKVVKFANKIQTHFSINDFLKGTYLEWDEKIKNKAIDSFRRLSSKGFLVKISLTRYCRHDANVTTYEPSVYDLARRK